jgi:hypoxanthine phosphoribosyltransferase
MTEALATSSVPPPIQFAHASEAEMARILDFYAVRWEYEPDTFPILWNLDGGVVESFAPDFYLPDLGIYLEMTTLRQRLVRKKNRKLRRLRELYPDVRIKLFYARDFRALMLKYGKLALVEGLSGASGQVVPGRDEPVPVEPLELLEPLPDLPEVVPVLLEALPDLPPSPAPAPASAAAKSAASAAPSPAAHRSRNARRRRARRTALARANAAAVGVLGDGGQATLDR